MEETLELTHTQNKKTQQKSDENNDSNHVVEEEARQSRSRRLNQSKSGYQPAEPATSQKRKGKKGSVRYVPFGFRAQSLWAEFRMRWKL